jgi:TPP-dependent pyruvate/acetoin dehydrogenase alpha subunit
MANSVREQTSSKTGDGNNFEEVCSLTEFAIENIQDKREPFLLELSTFRWLEHCGPNWDDHLGYSKKGELKKWMMKCPLKTYEKNLKNEDIIGDSDIIRINNNPKESEFCQRMLARQSFLHNLACLPQALQVCEPSAQDLGA